ncbi:MAG: hypothetical protein WKF59_20340 [Chitinophagaceae bacterium]
MHPVGRKRKTEADMISEERQTKHKGGRPRTQVSRSVTSLRLTKAEKYIIKNKAGKAGICYHSLHKTNGYPWKSISKTK